MKPVGNPLGHYSAFVASFIIIVIILAAIYSHLFSEPDQLLDSLAILAFGIVTGTAASLTTLNGTVKRTVEQDDELMALRKEFLDIKNKVQ